MSRSIELKRTVAVRAWRVTGMFAFGVKRQWEPAVLKLAQQYGAITSSAIVVDLLSGRKALAMRMLRICTGLGLLRKSDVVWTLTDAGRRAAESGVVLIPEQGAWTVWASEDPLLPSPIIAVEPWTGEPTASAESKQGVRSRTTKVPKWLLDCQGAEHHLLAGARREIRLDELGEQGEEVPSESLDMTLSWRFQPESADLRVVLFRGDTERETSLTAPDLAYEDVWQVFLEANSLKEQWDPVTRALAISFDETNDRERSTMLRDLAWTNPSIEKWGGFDLTTISDVRIRPRSSGDADAWAEWRLLNDLNTYLLGDDLADAWKQAASSFSDLASAHPPSRAELSQRARGGGRPPPRYWRLQAPADWALTSEDP